MAEVAGLVLGAVGVVGIRGAFKDAVELFSLITAPQKFSRDYEIRSTQLDIEKLILLHGADRVTPQWARTKHLQNAQSTSCAAAKKLPEIEVLDLNWFRMIEDRRDSVRGAYTKTLDWALRPQTVWSKVEKSGKCDGKKCHKYDKGVDCGIWKAARLQKPGENLSLPTTAETTFAMETFEKRYNGRKAFCFFIDGDDELEGDYTDSISILEQLTANKPIKAVVLSRPIPKCAMTFGQLPQLRLKDLNRPDIYTYVQDIIAQHSYMRKVSRSGRRNSI
ncbi:hypothetical protein SCUP515_12588 [Seiridium cupressi]